MSEICEWTASNVQNKMEGLKAKPVLYEQQNELVLNLSEMNKKINQDQVDSTTCNPCRNVSELTSTFLSSSSKIREGKETNTTDATSLIL